MAKVQSWEKRPRRKKQRQRRKTKQEEIVDECDECGSKLKISHTRTGNSAVCAFEGDGVFVFTRNPPFPKEEKLSLAEARHEKAKRDMQHPEYFFFCSRECCTSFAKKSFDAR